MLLWLENIPANYYGIRIMQHSSAYHWGHATRWPLTLPCFQSLGVKLSNTNEFIDLLFEKQKLCKGVHLS